MMIMTPVSAMTAPMMSYLSGLKPSIRHAHSSDITINIPPYVAYTLPKFEGCHVATMPYSPNITSPAIQ